MLRCLNGRNVACIRSKEIAAIPASEMRESQVSIMISTSKIGCHSRLKIEVNDTFLASQSLRRKTNTIILIVEIPPTNISATVKFMTKYMERVRRLLFFTKIIIDRKFTATTATAIVRDTANHVLHSAEEIAMEIIVSFQFSFLLPSERNRIKFV